MFCDCGDGEWPRPPQPIRSLRSLIPRAVSSSGLVVTRPLASARHRKPERYSELVLSSPVLTVRRVAEWM
ncbi:hypothetical protein D8S78_15090 [Natrialba swarupiae]|nr:hypothetical protein [Natrialba swarupiae]